MNLLDQLSRFTRVMLIFSILLLIYGYLCRIAGIYFFWESKQLGWIAFLVMLISFFIDRKNIKHVENKSAVGEKIAMGFFIFLLFLMALVYPIILFSDACAAAKIFSTSNNALTKEVGEIEGFGLMPTGSIQIMTDNSGKYGSAVINLTVKGSAKYKDVTLFVVKTVDSPDWHVEGVE